ncbi:MAG TPA: hypothetical protein DCL41_06180, partial [Bdellovibrionales bacterium]|nr:hypothetical protein [Bdellovibrionales bacterium]
MITLVLNVGLKNTRCIAFDMEGQVLSQVVTPVHTLVSNEKVEQVPGDWVSLSHQVICSVVKELGSRAEDIGLMTVTTSASCLVVVDKEGKPLGNSILVSDTRSTQECAELEKLPQFQRLKTRGFKASPDLMLPKILWLKKHKPRDFEKAYKFLNVGDYLCGYLTGEFVTDPSNASKFYYDSELESYPKELYSSLGIDMESLPQVIAPGQRVGVLRSEVSSELGIPAGKCRLVMSTYDALAAVAGNGAFEAGDAVDVSGTVTSFRVVSENFVIDSKKRFYTSSHVNANQWLLGGSNNLGGGVIEWLRLLLYKEKENPYELMEKDALSRSACPGGMIFLPYLLGERTPIWNSDCRGVFFGINRAHEAPDFSRAVFEGVAFSVAHIAESIKEYDVPINSVTAAGGLSRIGLINQIKSDVLGVPVYQFKNFETTAIGAALIALYGEGHFSSIKEAFEKFCAFEKSYEPD